MARVIHGRGRQLGGQNMGQHLAQDLLILSSPCLEALSSVTLPPHPMQRRESPALAASVCKPRSHTTAAA